MKKIFLFIVSIITLTFTGCRDVMDLEPLDRVSSDVILSSEDGMRAFFANLYYRIPMEEFNNQNGTLHEGWGLWHGIVSDAMSDNAIHSELCRKIEMMARYFNVAKKYEDKSKY